MRFFQYLYDQSLKNNSSSRVYKKILNLISNFYNPLVEYSIKSTSIFFPISHITPYYWKSDKGYSMSLGRVSKLIENKYRSSSFIDIGANVGDSALILRAENCNNKIYCIEGHTYFYKILLKNIDKLKNIIPINEYVGFEVLKSKNKIKFNKMGNAHIVTENEDTNKNDVSINCEIDFNTLSSIVNKYNIENIKLIKTDIETYDLPVLLSSIEIINKNKPILYFELHIRDIDEINKGVKWEHLWDRLRIAGYRKILYFHNSSKFLCALDIDDVSITTDLHNFYRNREGELYFDVCAIHGEDLDIYKDLYMLETAKNSQN
jgi:FkbM family methyltransferase